MKKNFNILSLTFLMLFLCSNLKAQEKYERLHFGPQLGFSSTDIRYKHLQYNDYQFVDDTIVYTNMIINVIAGLAIDYDLIPVEKYGVSIQAALMYSRKGCWNQIETYVPPSEDIDVMIHYIDIPIEFRCRCRMSKKICSVLGFGPSFNIGISQTNKIRVYESNGMKCSYTKHLQFGEGEGENGLHRLDIGANATIGIESYRGFRFDLAYYIPLRNLSIDHSKSVKYFSIAASMGYMF